MNIALITAAGVGNRMGQDVPKQFMTINECPVIIYTLKAFQQNDLIDSIAVVCLKGWEIILQAYAKQFNISKLKWVFEGGSSGPVSICNGLNGLKESGVPDDSVIIVHDGVRPLISDKIICDNIETCKKYGYAVTGLKCKEVIMKLDGECVKKIQYKRSELIRTQTPHTYLFKNLMDIYQKATEDDLKDSVATCDLCERVINADQHWVVGSEKNGLKLTNIEDVELFKAMIALPEDLILKK